MGFARAIVLVMALLAVVPAAVPVEGANAETWTLPAVTKSGSPSAAVAEAQVGSWVKAAVHPVITSIGPDTASAGTGSTLWISGYGFGALAGKAKVQFLFKQERGKSPAEYIPANNISFWSDTDIWCEVPVDNKGYPRSAASGPLTVSDANGVRSEPVDFSVTFGYWHRWKKPQYRFVVRTDDKGWLKMIRAAGKTWSDTDQFTFDYSNKKAAKPRLGNGINEVYWGKLSSDQTLAVTQTKTPSGGSFPSEADIVFNKSVSWGSSMPFKYDVQTLALHEMGHVVGLRDLYGLGDEEKAMFGWRDRMGPQGWSWGRHRKLTADDIAGATWIRKQYPSDGGAFPICTASGDQTSPAISGNMVVWVDGRNGNPDIYGYDLSTHKEFPICTAPGEQSQVRISGNTVVWTDYRDGEVDLPWGRSGDIYGYDLAAKREFVICDASGDQFSPTISGDTVVWEDMRWDNVTDLFGYDLSTSSEFYIPTSSWAMFPRVSGNRLVYIDSIDDGVITVYDLANGDTYTISPNAFNPEAFALDDDYYVWWDMRGSGWGVYGYDFTTGTEFPISIGGARTWAIAVSGGTVVWDAWPTLQSPEGDILGYNIATKSSFPVCTASGPQGEPAISGNTVVWMDKRNGNWDIYGRVLSE